MASPVFVRNSLTSLTAGATSLSHTLAIVDGAQGVWVLLISVKNNDNITCATAGWNKIGQQNSGASFTAALFMAQEGAGNPTFNWTNSARAHIESCYYKYASGTQINAAPTNYTSAGGSTNPFTTAAFTSSAADVLAVYAIAINQASTLFDAAAGWTENRENGSTTSAIDESIGSKAIATSGASSGAPSGTYFVDQVYVMFNVELGLGAAASPWVPRIVIC